MHELTDFEHVQFKSPSHPGIDETHQTFWFMFDSVVRCELGRGRIDLHDPKSLKKLEKSYEHCTTNAKCIGCGLNVWLS
jgi:hypothetical protein